MKEKKIKTGTGIIWSASYGMGEVKEEKTALEHFAKWLKYVPKGTKISVTQSEKTIVFIRTDIS